MILPRFSSSILLRSQPAILVLAAVLGGVLLVSAGNATSENIGDSWRGLTLAREDRCTPYARRDYPYPQSVEARIVASMDGRIYGPYTGVISRARGRRTSSISSPSPKRMTAASVRQTGRPAGALPATR